ncbi:ankyrin repeat domain-containing protein SOWAHC isoform X2 [Chanos chanos]|uniref:Ankyrin repeat domain-containing protein SOWAHC isoform X2 n=1 Tax=Chanos chanos TaxID=29144 RepID=A0A6J2V1C5_CHACN|nr:ankyrin repeat domain-containing protein SOWAHC-like isoform X2 [Chanos chanos]
MGDISEASLLDYIYSSGGKIKNSDLLQTYKHFISHNDLQLRAKYREEFKLTIDKIAVMKLENGEKYLVLRKKYKQLMQERQREQQTERELQKEAIISRPCATVQWDGPGGSSDSRTHGEQPTVMSQKQQGPAVVQVTEKGKHAQVSWCGGPTITITEAAESKQSEEEEQTDATPSPSAAEETTEPISEEPMEPTDGEDELDKDSGSKSESEQEEECVGSVGSASVALDPIEKEWIYSAACARLSHLTQLLKQEPSLANKKDFTSGFTALHWAAKHGREDMATVVVNAGADVNTKAGYTPLHIAALHDHRHIMDLLINTYGAKENVRDYSGHLACHYLSIRESHDEDSELLPGCSVNQAGERRNKKLTSLFHSRKRWGSAEELAPVPEERTVPHQLMIPAFRTRKFSR